MALFKYLKSKAPQKVSHENFIGLNPQKFSPANLSKCTVVTNDRIVLMVSDHLDCEM